MHSNALMRICLLTDIIFSEVQSGQKCLLLVGINLCDRVSSSEGRRALSGREAMRNPQGSSLSDKKTLQYTSEDYFFKCLYVHIYIVFNSFLLFSSSIKHEESMSLARKHFLLVISITIIEIVLLMKDLPPALQNVIYISNDHSSTIQT